MSTYIYITKEGKQKALSNYNNHKSLFEVVEFQSIGRWKKKKVFNDIEDIKYLLYKIQNYCIENGHEQYLTSLKVRCLTSHILLFDSDEKEYAAVFDDLNVQPYGFFYSSIESFLRKCEYFNNEGIVKVIEPLKECKSKDLIDLKFNKVILKNKVVFGLTISDFIESMHKDSNYKSDYNKVKQNGFFYYDVPFKLQKFFRINKQLNNNF